MNQNSTSQRSLVLAITVLDIILLVVFVAMYAWVVPKRQADAYSSGITAPFNGQSAAVAEAWRAFSTKDVFVKDNTDPTADAKDFADTNTLIFDRTRETNDLQRQNNSLKLLPGATLLGAGKTAQQTQRKVKTYIDQTNTFLTTYQTMISYMRDFETATVKDVPALQAALNAMNAAKDVPHIQAATQSGIAPTGAYIADLQKLKPSADFKQFHDTILQDMTQLQDGLNNIQGAITNKDSLSLAKGVLQMLNAGSSLALAESTNPDTAILKSSTIQKQFDALKSAHPLQ